MRSEEPYIGRPVRSLQTMLQAVGKLDPSLPNLNPDGIYGAQTLRCVKAFQKKQGLPQTGITDYGTWTAICAAYRNAEIELSPAEPLQISLSPKGRLSEGCEGPNVLLLQTLLHTAALQYANLSDCSLCGQYDKETVCAVKSLQAACQMPETGCLDKALWQLLTGLFQQSCGSEDAPRIPKPEGGSLCCTAHAELPLQQMESGLFA